jgi:hypothetical protein
VPEEAAEPRILVAIPTQGWVHRSLACALIEFARKNAAYWFVSEKPIENARNMAAKKCLDEGFDFLLMIDDDTVPMRSPILLANLNHDVMICPTLMFKCEPDLMQRGGYPYVWNALDWDEDLQKWREHLPREGLQEVDAGGTGCMMIARRVLEHPTMRHPFKRQWDEDGICTHSSDLTFCRRAKEAGFSIWAHYDFRCRHVKELELFELMQVSSYRDIVHANRPNINTPSYWDQQWADRPARPLPYYAMIADLCKGQRVLDFGCGRGDLLAMLDEGSHGIDFSAKAVEICRQRGLSAEVGDKPVGEFDTIVATEVLEHLDEDALMLEHFFDHADRVIYAVPYNTLPPSVEPEHRRCYTKQYVQQITPYLKAIRQVDQYLVVLAEREG